MASIPNEIAVSTVTAGKTTAVRTIEHDEFVDVTERDGMFVITFNARKLMEPEQLKKARNRVREYLDPNERGNVRPVVVDISATLDGNGIETEGFVSSAFLGDMQALSLEFGTRSNPAVRLVGISPNTNLMLKYTRMGENLVVADSVEAALTHKPEQRLR